MTGVVHSREDRKNSRNRLPRCRFWPQPQRRRWRIRMFGLLLCGFLFLARRVYFWQNLSSPTMDRMNTTATTAGASSSSSDTVRMKPAHNKNKEEEETSFQDCPEEEDQDESKSILEEKERQQRQKQRLSQRPLADPNSIHALLQRTSTTTTSDGDGEPQQPQPQAHFLTTLSGCRMARWILGLYEEHKDPRRAQRSDCYRELQLDPSKVLPSLSSNSNTSTTDMMMMMSKIQPYDTMYVTWEQLRDFVQDILPQLHQPILLLSGQRENVGVPSPSIISTILHHSMISYWFVQNMETYLLPALATMSSSLSSQSGALFRHKVASFPCGLKQRADKDEILEPTHGPAYRTVFWESLQQQQQTPKQLHSNRSTRFFQGYVTVANNPRDRGGTGGDGNSGSPVFLAPLDYYHQLADSDYVWSPNGDRRETHRHYEALGLGAAPVTQWSRRRQQQGRFSSSASSSSSCQSHYDYPAYDHLLHTGLVYADDYNHTFANLEAWMLHVGDPVVVNRNVILEEYWMDYINVYTNQSWTWWNRYPLRKKKHHANQDDTDDVFEKRGPITTHQLLGDLAARMEP